MRMVRSDVSIANQKIGTIKTDLRLWTKLFNEVLVIVFSMAQLV
jgi:hypothetical protein